MLIGSFTHPLAIALQLLAIILALRLIPLTGRAKAWLVFSAAFTLMGMRRVIEFLGDAGVIPSGAASKPGMTSLHWAPRFCWHPGFT